MFPFRKKTHSETQPERETQVSPYVDDKPKQETRKRRAYDLGSQSKLNRKMGGRLVDDYASLG